MELIGLSGYAQSGKDTAADVMKEFGYERVAFADVLRSAVYALNPLMPDGRRVQDIVDEMGWDSAKVNFTEIRTLLQKMGTEVGRNLLGENVWVDTALNGLDPNGKYVVTDCRFPNEAAAIRDRGGIVIRVARAGVKRANDHPSETSLDNYDFDDILVNDGPLDWFQTAVRKKMHHEYTTSRV
jgi:hypothetical protein